MTLINRFLVLTAILLAPACTTEDEPTDITGRYGNLTGVSDTVITIGKTSDGYSFRCTYEEFPKTRAKEYYIWKGTFRNTPSDTVTDSEGNQIGTVSVHSDYVSFTATTQRPDTYKAYRDEMADLSRSHSR